jgi:hypothetical protein
MSPPRDALVLSAPAAGRADGQRVTGAAAAHAVPAEGQRGGALAERAVRQDDATDLVLCQDLKEGDEPGGPGCTLACEQGGVAVKGIGQLAELEGLRDSPLH